MIKLMRIQGNRSGFDSLVTECACCGAKDIDVYAIVEDTRLAQAFTAVSPHLCNTCFGRMVRQKEIIDARGGD